MEDGGSVEGWFDGLWDTEQTSLCPDDLFTLCRISSISYTSELPAATLICCCGTSNVYYEARHQEQHGALEYCLRKLIRAHGIITSGGLAPKC